MSGGEGSGVRGAEWTLRYATGFLATALGITKQGKVAKWPVALRYVASDSLTPVPSPRKYLGEGRMILSCQVLSRNPIARKRHVARNTFPTDQ